MLLKTENLSKAYESRKKGEPVFWAAREVCLEIPEGKTIGLLVRAAVENLRWVR